MPLEGAGLKAASSSSTAKMINKGRTTNVLGPIYAWIGGADYANPWFFFKSKVEDNPWLLLEFEYPTRYLSTNVSMYGLTIITRKDCCGHLLRNLHIRAGMSSEFRKNPLVGTFKGPGSTNSEHYVSFGGKVTEIKYLSFQMVGVRSSLQINGIRPNYNPGNETPYTSFSHIPLTYKST